MVLQGGLTGTLELDSDAGRLIPYAAAVDYGTHRYTTWLLLMKRLLTDRF